MTEDPAHQSTSIFDTMVDPTPAVVQPSPMIGSPDADVSEWDGQQSLNTDCAIRAQQFVIEQFTHTKLSEIQLVEEATQHGWFDLQTGTSPQDMGKELELHGIPVTQYDHANAFTLANELAQGHKVILGVDAGELWNQVPDGTADHAVVVSGIDATDPQHPLVIVSDPGTGQGEARYPMDQFLQAWRASDFFMVATQQAPPPSAPGMAGFDYTTGHIPTVAGVPYDQFVSMADHPDQFDHLLDQSTGGVAPLTTQEIFHEANPDTYPPADTIDHTLSGLGAFDREVDFGRLAGVSHPSHFDWETGHATIDPETELDHFHHDQADSGDTHDGDVHIG
jgi:hypothetical protein